MYIIVKPMHKMDSITGSNQLYLFSFQLHFNEVRDTKHPSTYCNEKAKSFIDPPVRRYYDGWPSHILRFKTIPPAQATISIENIVGYLPVSAVAAIMVGLALRARK